MSDDILKFGRKILASQPFSELMGTELQKFETGIAELSLEIKEHHKQQHGFAHGGVISYLADNALTFAGGSVLGDSLTLEFKINYVRPALGQVLIAKARVTANGRQQAVCHCDIYAINDGEEKLCATAQGTIWKIEPKDK